MYVCMYVCMYVEWFVTIAKSQAIIIMAVCHKRLAELSGVPNQQSNNEGNQFNPVQHDNCVY